MTVAHLNATISSVLAFKSFPLCLVIQLVMFAGDVSLFLIHLSLVYTML